MEEVTKHQPPFSDKGGESRSSGSETFSSQHKISPTCI